MFSLSRQFCKIKFFNKLLEINFVLRTVVSLFECKPKSAFYVNKFYVYNV